MCGIFGVVTQEEQASSEVFEGLSMLQHRGQDSAGIVTWDGKTFHYLKENGLARDVFASREKLQGLKGKMGIGHVRYPTAGTSSASEAQPFFVNAPLGIWLIHNGNVTNPQFLATDMFSNSYRRMFLTKSDTEVLLNAFAVNIHMTYLRDPGLADEDLVFEAARKLMNDATGAFSCITLINNVGLFCFRDKHGIRPLTLGIVYIY